MPNLLSPDMSTSRSKHILDSIVRVLVVLMAIAMGVSLYLVLIMGLQIQNLGEQNKKLNEENVHIGQRLIDCTTAGHKCFDDGNKHTGEAVLTIDKVVEAAAICSHNLPSPIVAAKMDACIRTTLPSVGK